MTAIPPVLTLVLAGGKSDALHALGRIRTASALPYGGKYRVIDFSLSNCVHSGLARIGILTQYAPLSLQGHIGIGRAWDLDRRDGGVRLLQPYVRPREANWYRGPAGAIVQNPKVIEDHRGYWRDIGTVDSYYESNMDLVRPVPPLNLYDPDWLIYTPSEDRSPAVLGPGAAVTQSLISHGARVEGEVSRSVLFPGVHVGDGARVEDSIVMHDARIEPAARLKRTIVDKRVVIGSGASLGFGEGTPNREFPGDLGTGLCVVGKGSHIPEGVQIGTNTLIEIGVCADDFTSREVPSGSVIRPGGQGRAQPAVRGLSGGVP